MRRLPIAFGLALACQTAGAAETADIESLLQKLEALEQEQQALKAQLHELKQAQSAPAAAAAAPATDRRGQVSSGSDFNPRISVILDGVYYGDNAEGEGEALLGAAAGINAAHDHGDEGHAHGSLERGFNLRETEIAFSATVDPYFDADAYLTVADDGGVELEEAYFTSRNLPAGLRLKGGKFYSDIGYVNSQHPHQWDFVDQNLPYRALIGPHGLGDTGIQLTWLPAWDHYTRFGVELLQGEQETFGNVIGSVDSHAHEEEPEHAEEEHSGELAAVDAGPRLYTAFVKWAPELGYDHALQLGLSAAHATQHQELHEAGAADEHALEGDAWLYGVDAVYKYDSGRAYGDGDLTLQGEYLYAIKDLDVAYHMANPAVTGAERRFSEDGFYLQGSYGFAPRWFAGLRYDSVGGTNKLESGGETLASWGSSDRWSAALTFKPTEFSRLRLQYARAAIDDGTETDRLAQWYLQYQQSLGSHGAHEF